MKKKRAANKNESIARKHIDFDWRIPADILLHFEFEFAWLGQLNVK